MHVTKNNKIIMFYVGLCTNEVFILFSDQTCNVIWMISANVSVENNYF